jgi:hypothetical protein
MWVKMPFASVIDNGGCVPWKEERNNGSQFESIFVSYMQTI